MKDNLTDAKTLLKAQKVVLMTVQAIRKGRVSVEREYVDKVKHDLLSV